MSGRYVAVADHDGCILVREYIPGSSDNQIHAFVSDLTGAFRRARMMSGERPGLILEPVGTLPQSWGSLTFYWRRKEEAGK